MPTTEPHQFLAFGIPSLDRLMGSPTGDPGDPERVGYLLADATGRTRGGESATLCIIGPDGTGKSNYALHLAAEYWRRTAGLAGPQPRIVYASSDLSHERATQVWQAFWLDRPRSRWRRLPFEKGWRRAHVGLDADEQREAQAPLKLERFDPAEERFSNFLAGDGDGREIGFLDLESTTSGDDWAFLHAMLAVLPTPADGAPRHMLVIDAVEGLETLVGERDAFGQLQSRRARIAQIVRAAAGKCHLAIVVEEPIGGERLPEVFVADVVLRLRSETDRDYARRTAELEKVRGQRHIRGQHDFRIRQQRSHTGRHDNPDDPSVGCRGREGDATGDAVGDATPPVPLPVMPARMAYIQLFPSLHYLTRDTHRPPPVGSGHDRPARTAWRYAAFGIYELDSMLWQAATPAYDPDKPDGCDDPGQFDKPAGEWVEKKRKALCADADGRLPGCIETCEPDGLWRVWDDRVGVVPDAAEKPLAGFDRMGLPAGSVTTLIGSDSTYKSHLAMAFLSQCFRTRHVLSWDGTYLPVVVANGADADPLQGQGVAVLLATYDTDRDQLRERVLKRHLIRGPKLADEACQTRGLEEQVIVRALEPHHLPASLFVHVVRELVTEAKRLLARGLRSPVYPTDAECADGAPDADQKRRVRQRLHGRIRLVIDDWSTLLAMYPEVQRDPLVVPYLMAYLRREGVTALILATRPGNPNDRGLDPLDQDIRELRRMADHHLHTWHVPFFDERRVAVTVQPSPVPGAGSLVRELRPARVDEVSRRGLADLPAAPARPQTERDRADDRNEYDPEVVVVDPHFELYSGLPDEQPVPVPLEVSLYAERADIAGFQDYLTELNDLFGHLFGRHPGRDACRPKYGVEYEHLRERSYLQSEARLTHTLVMQVDEFWAESRSELYRQERYLTARTVDLEDDPGKPRRPVRMEDPFGLYSLSDALEGRSKVDGPKPFDPVWRSGPRGPLQRYQFFDLIGYDLRRAMKRYPIDKVPYSWDFGFLLCNRALWERHAGWRDHRTNRVHGPGPDDYQQQTVRDIWLRMWKIADPFGEVDKYYRSSGEGLPDLPAVVEGAEGEERMPDALKFELSRLAAHWIDHHWGVDETSKGRVPRLAARFGEPGPGTGPPASRSQRPPSSTAGKLTDRAVSWREFLGACKVVAKAAHHENLAFDIDLQATESFSCLVLEVWFSELQQALHLYDLVNADARGVKVEDLRQAWRRWDRAADRPSHRRDDPRSAGLKDLLTTPADRPHHRTEDGKVIRNDRRDAHPSQFFRRALYRTMLLLDEVIGRDQLAGGPPDQPLAIGARAADARAVASRHWYSTAAMALADEDAARSRVVVGLPGRFTARGDWFLAVAQGSRSPRLGERAMDILNSRRANIIRLQAGIGLPVRDQFPVDPARPEERSEYWTPLAYADDQTPRERIRYRELRKLGAYDAQDNLGRGEFYWLWRSSIAEYDIHARLWQKWLVRLVLAWKEWGRPHPPAGDGQFQPLPHMVGRPWWDGFAEYDYCLRADHRVEHPTPLLPCYVDTSSDQFDQFDRMCDGLIEAMSRTANPPQLARAPSPPAPPPPAVPT